MDFVTLIEELKTFWKQQGCMLWFNHPGEVGAGTFNPATFFGVLGSAHTKVAYVEPSRRPTDGRYGENPNRLQQYFQFQVILKPSPVDGQNLFIKSLQHLGISTAQNDLRFVKDDWKSPTLGAAGLGWEVWLNGMEITQFTYFQQMAGKELQPISLEITYGIERIFLAMHAGKKTLKDASANAAVNAPVNTSAKKSASPENVEKKVETLSIFNLPFYGSQSYGFFFKRREEDFSAYNFTVANIEFHKQLFSGYEAEAAACVKAHLPYPAYDNVIKCSHVFNMLDARGAISVTQREDYIARIRTMAVATANVFLTKEEVKKKK